jgi:hypothetical protein
VRPRGLEPPRTIQSTRPSTLNAACRCVERRPNRPKCEVPWTDWTGWRHWMLSRVLSRPGPIEPCRAALCIPRTASRRRQRQGARTATDTGLTGLSADCSCTAALRLERQSRQDCPHGRVGWTHGWVRPPEEPDSRLSPHPSRAGPSGLITQGPTIRSTGNGSSAGPLTAAVAAASSSARLWP